MKFITYNKSGKILRGGHCQASTFRSQARKENVEFVVEGIANDVTQKVEFDGFDSNGQPINPRIVDKTHAEIERDNPKREPTPFEEKRAAIKNKDWKNVLDRIKVLEEK